MYSKSINVIGIMSGTSLDGLDLCLVSFDSNNYSNFKILNSQTYYYSSDWVNKLSNAINLREKDLNVLICYTKCQEEIPFYQNKKYWHLIY